MNISTYGERDYAFGQASRRSVLSGKRSTRRFCWITAARRRANQPRRTSGLLLEYLREARALIVLGNLEAMLEEGAGTGRMRAGYEGYGRLLRRVAETMHQSCLLLISREKPGDLVALEGGRALVRALRLEGLERDASEQLLEERELVGNVPERERPIEAYGGNPLALLKVSRMRSHPLGRCVVIFHSHWEGVFRCSSR